MSHTAVFFEVLLSPVTCARAVVILKADVLLQTKQSDTQKELVKQ